MNSLKPNTNNYYRQLIVKHYSAPENKGLLKTKNSLTFHHFSNSCVDDFFVELTFEHNQIVTARFEGIGCAISTAAIDMFCSIVKNNDINFVKRLSKNYQLMLSNQEFNEELIAELLAFKNVLKQPHRIRCALIISESIDEIFKLKVNANE